MAYTLQAVLGPAAVIRQVAAELPAAALITLPQGTAMLPVPDRRRHRHTEGWLPTT